MKPVTAYASFDGNLFKTAKECADYEKRCSDIAKIVDKIPKFKPTQDFLAGNEYHQHDISVLDIKKEFLTYISDIFNINLLELNNIKISEVITLKGDQPIMMAWFRIIGCIDNQARHWISISLVKEPYTEENTHNPYIT